VLGALRGISCLKQALASLVTLDESKVVLEARSPHMMKALLSLEGKEVAIEYGESEVISLPCSSVEHCERELLRDDNLRQALVLVGYLKRTWTFPKGVVTGFDAVNVVPM